MNPLSIMQRFYRPHQLSYFGVPPEVCNQTIILIYIMKRVYNLNIEVIDFLLQGSFENYVLNRDQYYLLILSGYKPCLYLDLNQRHLSYQNSATTRLSYTGVDKTGIEPEPTPTACFKALTDM